MARKGKTNGDARRSLCGVPEGNHELREDIETDGYWRCVCGSRLELGPAIAHIVANQFRVA